MHVDFDIVNDEETLATVGNVLTRPSLCIHVDPSNQMFTVFGPREEIIKMMVEDWGIDERDAIIDEEVSKTRV